MREEESNEWGNITSNIINVMRRFAVKKGQPRRTGDTINGRGPGRTRAGAPHLQRITVHGPLHDEKPAIKFRQRLQV